jgi:hypothetical protein
MELLTVDQFREHTETALGNDAIQRLIDDAIAAINDHCGTVVFDDYMVGEELIFNDYGVWAGKRILHLDYVPSSITSVMDVDTLGTETELVEGDDEDWVQDGKILRRRSGVWGRHTRVTYMPNTAYSQRQALAIKLVDLSINIQPGQGFAGAATWQETFKDYEQEKQRLLWSLCAPPVFA